MHARLQVLWSLELGTSTLKAEESGFLIQPPSCQIVLKIRPTDFDLYRNSQDLFQVCSWSTYLKLMFTSPLGISVGSRILVTNFNADPSWSRVNYITGWSCTLKYSTLQLSLSHWHNVGPSTMLSFYSQPTSLPQSASSEPLIELSEVTRTPLKLTAHLYTDDNIVSSETSVTQWCRLPSELYFDFDFHVRLLTVRCQLDRSLWNNCN